MIGAERGFSFSVQSLRRGEVASAAIMHRASASSPHLLAVFLNSLALSLEVFQTGLVLVCERVWMDLEYLRSGNPPPAISSGSSFQTKPKWIAPERIPK